MESNQIKPKHPGGRPTKYKPEYCQAILDYFNKSATTVKQKTYVTKNGTEIVEEVEKANAMPTIEGFARSIEINTESVTNWVKDHEEFSDAYLRAKAMQKDILIENGLKGLYNSQFATFVAINCTDMRQKTEVAHTGADGQPLTVIVHRGSDLAALPEPVERIENAQVIDTQELDSD